MESNVLVIVILIILLLLLLCVLLYFVKDCNNNRNIPSIENNRQEEENLADSCSSQMHYSIPSDSYDTQESDDMSSESEYVEERQEMDNAESLSDFDMAGADLQEDSYLVDYYSLCSIPKTYSPAVIARDTRDIRRYSGQEISDESFSCSDASDDYISTKSSVLSGFDYRNRRSNSYNEVVKVQACSSGLNPISGSNTVHSSCIRLDSLGTEDNNLVSYTFDPMLRSSSKLVLNNSDFSFSEFVVNPSIYAEFRSMSPFYSSYSGNILREMVRLPTLGFCNVKGDIGTNGLMLQSIGLDLQTCEELEGNTVFVINQGDLIDMKNQISNVLHSDIKPGVSNPQEIASAMEDEYDQEESVQGVVQRSGITESSVVGTEQDMGTICRGGMRVGITKCLPDPCSGEITDSEEVVHGIRRLSDTSSAVVPAITQTVKSGRVSCNAGVVNRNLSQGWRNGSQLLVKKRACFESKKMTPISRNTTTIQAEVHKPNASGSISKGSRASVKVGESSGMGVKKSLIKNTSCSERTNLVTSKGSKSVSCVPGKSSTFERTNLVTSKGSKSVSCVPGKSPTFERTNLVTSKGSKSVSCVPGKSPTFERTNLVTSKGSKSVSCVPGKSPTFERTDLAAHKGPKSVSCVPGKSPTFERTNLVTSKGSKSIGSIPVKCSASKDVNPTVGVTAKISASKSNQRSVGKSLRIPKKSSVLGECKDSSDNDVDITTKCSMENTSSIAGVRRKYEGACYKGVHHNRALRRSASAIHEQSSRPDLECAVSMMDHASIGKRPTATENLGVRRNKSSATDAEYKRRNKCWLESGLIILPEASIGRVLIRGVGVLHDVLNDRFCIMHKSLSQYNKDSKAAIRCREVNYIANSRIKHTDNIVRNVVSEWVLMQRAILWNKHGKRIVVSSMRDLEKIFQRTYADQGRSSVDYQLKLQDIRSDVEDNVKLQIACLVKDTFLKNGCDRAFSDIALIIFDKVFVTHELIIRGIGKCSKEELEDKVVKNCSLFHKDKLQAKVLTHIEGLNTFLEKQLHFKSKEIIRKYLKTCKVDIVHDDVKHCCVNEIIKATTPSIATGWVSDIFSSRTNVDKSHMQQPSFG
ncbi:hypothetical protein [Ehrlichia muris]|uniref:Uncharacterized protein n=1 Tax=Ehrlichia muris AS145 TaxID=1423892 RepID=V9RA37_9RICK|nr:hypothetical protein [Ehrlichia muris]AHC39736.1 hypothetical protein EMUR_03750 [Ehrlichia muris AS145]